MIVVYIVLAVLCPLLCLIASYIGARYGLVRFVEMMELIEVYDKTSEREAEEEEC